MEKGPNVQYEALGGKDLECAEFTVLLKGSAPGRVLFCNDVPVTGVARSVHGPSVLELVDYGLSGAATAFD